MSVIRAILALINLDVVKHCLPVHVCVIGIMSVFFGKGERLHKFFLLDLLLTQTGFSQYGQSLKPFYRQCLYVQGMQNH